MNNGDDTAYYLHLGHRVISVEADPQLCERVRARCRDYIATGHLIIENVGVAQEFGKMEFWVSDKSVWSSFDKGNALRRGMTAHPITVETVSFASLIDKHGIPDFAKIDIEGNDLLCLEQLTENSCPEYISIEMSYADDGKAMELLRQLGYSAFKVVRQNDFMQLTPETIKRQMAIRTQLAKFGRYGQNLRRLTRRHLRVDNWTFCFGSSGPMPSGSTGAWLSHNELLGLWQVLRDTDLRLGSGGLGEWYDVHAHRRRGDGT